MTLFRTILFLALAVTTIADPAPIVKETCQSIQLAIPNRVSYRGSTAYENEIADYFNGGIRAMKPACVVHPTSSEEVSSTVKILAAAPQEVRFAVKSGGHDPNKGHSSVHEGVLIALRNLNGTKYDREKKVAYVKPGGNWKTLTKVLAKDKVAVVGGRVGVVGVGGLLTQGGLSFLSGQHGLATDNVLEFETVMANGSIVRVTQDSNPDLMVAMKGGGSQFGIVTQFTLRTYPMETVWGGIRAYSSDQLPALFAALHRFIGQPKDPKAAIIFISAPAVDSTTVSMFWFYDGPKPPPGAFCGFEDIKPMIDMTSEILFETLLGGFVNINPQFSLGSVDSDWLPSLTVRNSWRSQTLPWNASDPGAYQRIVNNHARIWANQTTRWDERGSLASIVVFQPWQTSLIKASKDRGGNAMGMTLEDGPQYVLEMHQMWLREKHEDKQLAMTKELFKLTNEDILSKRPEQYSPLFMNDASSDQKVFASYRDVVKFKAIQQEIDPKGLWTRSGGFKITL